MMTMYICANETQIHTYIICIYLPSNGCVYVHLILYKCLLPFLFNSPGSWWWKRRWSRLLDPFVYAFPTKIVRCKYSPGVWVTRGSIILLYYVSYILGWNFVKNKRAEKSQQEHQTMHVKKIRSYPLAPAKLLKSKT